MPDLERAFATFHNSQCARFGIVHSATDFKTALKELDGTFVATRKIENSVLVRFQNPSIRDFMQNLLLGGEMLSEVIDSVVFFEQIQWFLETLRDEQPRVSLKELTRHAPKVINTLQRLFEAESCSFVVSGYQPSQRVWAQPANPAKRLAIVALAVGDQRSLEEDAWIEGRMFDLASKTEAGSLSPSVFDGPVKELATLGCLGSPAGKRLVNALTRRALERPEDLDEFEILANLVSVLPQCFAKSELDSVREAYAEFVERFAAECDAKSPDEIRDDAERIAMVGGLLRVDTDAEQETLRDFAREIEEEQESRWDDDDERGGGVDGDVCSDGELDSMFRTLRS